MPNRAGVKCVRGAERVPRCSRPVKALTFSEADWEACNRLDVPLDQVSSDVIASRTNIGAVYPEFAPQWVRRSRVR